MRTFSQSEYRYPNVPQDVLVIAECSVCSGEHNTTYYADAEGNLRSVGSWAHEKPQPLTMSELCRETGLWESIVNAEWQAWCGRVGGVTRRILRAEVMT